MDERINVSNVQLFESNTYETFRLLCKFSVYKGEFTRNYSVNRAQISDITDIAILFQYLEMLFTSLIRE